MIINPLLSFIVMLLIDSNESVLVRQKLIGILSTEVPLKVAVCHLYFLTFMLESFLVTI